MNLIETAHRRYENFVKKMACVFTEEKTNITTCVILNRFNLDKYQHFMVVLCY